ncbi:Hsp70 family protein [Skermania sp. ID1734]|uniref:Hsp70 family protein n=1 Tax=Skermania sp. ID1734 TaxID=2597516 RepID=UPI00163D4103|nr:Hsp70 family protein [Skermania sp. ID1734]
MRTALGVSVGNDVVCSALVTTTPNGVRTFEYRMIAADDQANTDTGDLVASSIDLMTTQLPSRAVQPGGIAVAYRSAEQEQAVRAAAGGRRRDLQLVPETAAALTYLRSTGEVAQHETIAIMDVGATGCTVTVLNQVDGTTTTTERTDNISGAAIDDLVTARLTALAEHRGRRADREYLAARARAAKEALSNSDAATIDTVDSGQIRLRRDEFEELIAPMLQGAAEFTQRVSEAAPQRPQLIVVIGGGAYTPGLHHALVDRLGLPVLLVDEPEAVIAKGAALMADSVGPVRYPVVSMPADHPVGTFAKVAGALLGAVVVIGLLVGYGVQALSAAGTTPDLAPAATTVARPTSAVATTTAAPPPAMPVQSRHTPTPPTSDYPGWDGDPGQTGHTTESAPLPTTTAGVTTTTTTSPKTSTPTLRPGPGLPEVPWPQIQQWFPGQSTSPETTSTTAAPPTSAAPAAPNGFSGSATNTPAPVVSPAPVEPQQQRPQVAPNAPAPRMGWPNTGSTG